MCEDFLTEETQNKISQFDLELYEKEERQAFFEFHNKMDDVIVGHHKDKFDNLWESY